MSATRREFDAEDEALIADLMAVIRKHGLECRCTTRELAEYVVLSMEAWAHVEFRRLDVMAGQGDGHPRFAEPPR